MAPQEEGVESFIDKEDKYTPLPILPSGSCGITVTEADIATLRREVISFNDDNDPSPENVMHYDDVLPTPNHVPLDFMASILGVRVGTSLLGGSRWKLLQTQGYSTCNALTYS